MLKLIAFIFLSEVCSLTGQIFFKKGVTGLEGSYFNFIKKTLSSPKIWAGLACISIGIVIWLMALAQAELSLVYPIDSMQYLLVLIGSWVFLREKIDADKLLGTLFVIIGIILVAKS